MTDVLIYLLDRKYEEELLNLFSSNHLNGRIVYELEELVEVAQQELFDVLVVWAATYEDAADLLTVLNIHHLHYLPVVAVTEKDQRVDELLSLPIVDFMRLPLPREEFYRRIEQAIQDVDQQTTVLEGSYWHGSLEEFNLIDLIQMIESRGKDAILSLAYKNHQGEVYFKEGNIVQALFHGLEGLPALLKLASWQKGNFQIRFTEPPLPEKPIEEKNQEILLQIIQKLAEQNKFFERLPKLYEEVLLNPYSDTSKLTPLEQEIISLCETPISMFEILVSLDEDDLEILKHLQNLYEQKIIGEKTVIESQIQDEKQKSSLSKIFNSISSLFKKKTKLEEPSEMDETEEVELVPPRIDLRPEIVNDADLQIIQEKIMRLR